MTAPPQGLEFKTLAVSNPAEPDTQGVIEALVAVTGVKDEVGDIIEPGAFRRTLAERPRPKVCLGHDWNRPIGKTLEIRELLPGDRRLPKTTADGSPWPRSAGALWARFQVNLESEDGRGAFSAAKFYGPAESTYSIGYRTTRARQRGSVRHIQDMDLFEYGPVLNPANRLATLQSIKSDGELTSLVDSERQDFETGDGATVETKVKYVRDADYWGKPIGTPITPGMKPRGGNDRDRGTADEKPRTSSFFGSLPSDQQATARALPTDQRMVYLDALQAGKDHDEALAEARPAPKPRPPAEPAREPVAETPKAPDKPPAKPRKKGPWKPTAKQKAAIFDARPGSVSVRRTDENGAPVYGAPYPIRRGLVFKVHANTAYPLVREGYAESGIDGFTYILTPKGEKLRADLEKGDADRQAQLKRERMAAALGPEVAAVADANVVADAPLMDMTPRQFVDAQLNAEARRIRANNIRDEEAKAATERAEREAAEVAASTAPGAIDIEAFRRQHDQPRAELIGDDRLVLNKGGTKSWTVSTVDNLAAVRAVDFEEYQTAKPPGKRAMRDLGDRLAALRDDQGRPVPFDYPKNPDTTAPAWIKGWRDAEGNDLQFAMDEVIRKWGEDNGLTYRRRTSGPRPLTVPGGEPDADGFCQRPATELAAGDEVRLPDGSVATVERSGFHGYLTQDRELEGSVLLADGRKVGLRELAGLEPLKPREIKPGESRTDAMVARRYGGADAGPSSRTTKVPVRFADGADSPEAGNDPGMGSIPATAGPPGRAYDRAEMEQRLGQVYAGTDRNTPLPEGTRVVYQPDPEGILNRERDSRPKVGTLLPLVELHGGDMFQAVRLDDGTYDQYRIGGMRQDMPADATNGFVLDPDPETIDEVRARRGLAPVGESTPLRRDADPEPVAEPEVPADSEPETPPAPEVEPEPVAAPAAEEAAPEVEEAAPEVEEAAPEVEPETPPALPYEIIRKPTRNNLTARVRYNGREYDVTATNGVDARVTVSDDDGHTATVSGGSTTLLLRERGPDRERAVRQALDQVAAQHEGDPTGDPVPETPVEPVEETPSETVRIEPELVDEAAALQDEVLGITEQPDGTIEVTEEVAARQDRVAKLIEDDDAGTLDLSAQDVPTLTATRGELAEELRLQAVLAARQATPKPRAARGANTEPEAPRQRPGLAGAAEDYSEALQSGDAEAIARTRARLESSLRRSRAGSEAARSLANHVTGENEDDAEQLATLARRMRTEARERRNAAAKRRRTARRLERARIQSLLDKVDNELQSRARTVEPEEPERRREPRSAAELREEITRLEAEMERVAGVDDNEDNAIVNLSPNSRSRAARNAGRRRFASMDRDLARYTELRQRRDNLRSSLARAEARERRTEREAKPTISKADLANAEMIRDSRDGGWKKVRRVNATTVTVEPRYAGLDAPKIPHDRIIGVQTSDDIAGRADTLAANYLEMHGTDGVRAMVERLRGRAKLSKGDQALLAALEALLGKAPAGTPA